MAASSSAPLLPKHHRYVSHLQMSISCPRRVSVIVGFPYPLLLKCRVEWSRHNCFCFSHPSTITITITVIHMIVMAISTDSYGNNR